MTPGPDSRKLRTGRSYLVCIMFRIVVVVVHVVLSSVRCVNEAKISIFATGQQ